MKMQKTRRFSTYINLLAKIKSKTLPKPQKISLIITQYLSPNKVTNALTLLAEAAADYHDNFQRYGGAPGIPYSGEDNDSDGPVFYRFQDDGGSGAILRMSSFPPDKSEKVWELVQEEVHRQFSVGV